MKYQPAGKRNTGRSLKRLMDFNIVMGMGHKSKVLEMVVVVVISLLSILNLYGVVTFGILCGRK
jgi:hypothetical protein